MAPTSERAGSEAPLENQPGPVRGEDSFDIARVDRWLRERVEGLTGPPEVRQFTGGASNLTYLLRYPERELVLRRPPPGTKAATAHDMRREADIQRRLRPVYPSVPELLAFCEEQDVLGSDFYVMERITGAILRGRGRQQIDISASAARGICEAWVDRMVELHQVDVSAAGLADLGRGEGYVERQIGGWSERYRQARTWNVPRFERVMRWLAERQPPDRASCVVHNDFRLDNVVLDPSEPRRIVGVLDWEMATVGDPLMDLGNSLAYWVQADDDRAMQLLRRQPTHLPGMLTRRELVDRYCEATGIDPPDITFYEVYGLFRLAAIIQQIYRRYHRRETRNPAFRRYWLAVGYLDRRCRRLIIDRANGQPVSQDNRRH
ncbi:MAG TPA: phosphotransferase family protein [Solirubrobacteraceae bacterium]|nr:phosphotransferase family protein [Solirubrobacteraceae bacterium]